MNLGFGHLDSPLGSYSNSDKSWAECLTSESMTNIKEESSPQEFVFFLIPFNLIDQLID